MHALAALVLAAADLILNVEPFPSTSRNGIAYVSGSVHNAGPDAVAAELVVELPPAVHLRDSQYASFRAAWRCEESGSTVTCRNPAFAARESYSFRLDLESTSGSGKPLALPVTLRSNADDPKPENNHRTAVAIWRQVFRVTSSNDDGDGTLRRGIDDLNAQCRGDRLCELLFDLPQRTTVAPLTPLPPLTACGVRMSVPVDDVVTISGEHVASGNGLELRTACSVPINAETSTYLERVAVGGFPGNGIFVAPARGGGAYRISDIFVGTDGSGTLARPNGGRGIVVETSATIDLDRSVISGNARSGIYVTSDAYIEARRMLIGVGRDGAPLPNGASGIYLGAGHLYVDAASTIAHHPHFGVALQPGTTGTIDANIHSNGVQAIDWGLDGPTPNRSEGRFVNKPAVLDAYYDAGAKQTVIVVAAPLGGWDFSRVSVYANHARNASARAEMERRLGTTYLQRMLSPSERVTFRVPGDLRGEIITAVQYYDPWGDLSQAMQMTSEVSDGLVVR